LGWGFFGNKLTQSCCDKLHARTFSYQVSYQDGIWQSLATPRRRELGFILNAVLTSRAGQPDHAATAKGQTLPLSLCVGALILQLFSELEM